MPHPTKKQTQALGPDARLRIAHEYAGGLSAEKVAAANNVSAGFVRDCVRRAGVPKRTCRDYGRKLNVEQKRALISAYQVGGRTKDLAAQYGLDLTSIYSLLRSHGVRVRTNSEERREYELNPAAFDTVTEESAYWAGFLMADGCIAGPRADHLIVQLQEGDRGHLEKFRQFLRSTHPICFMPVPAKPHPRGWTIHPLVRFNVTSRPLCESLARYGVLPRKSHTARVADLEDNRHFWRGVIDGDGSVCRVGTTRTYPLVNLVGSEPLLQQFAAFVGRHLCRQPPSVRPSRNIYAMAVNGKDAVRLVQILYGDCTVALDRKLATATAIMDYAGQTNSPSLWNEIVAPMGSSLSASKVSSISLT